jgi:hemolysin activation/secretion protein
MTVLALAPGPAHAQSTAEPGSIERTIPTHLSQDRANPTISTPGRQARSAPVETGRFTLGAVNVRGATVFSQAELGKDFESYLASEIDEAKLAELANRITNRYRRGGYLLSYASVPTQSVEAGMVRLAVVEGRIASISVEGAGPARGAVEAIAAPLLADAPLRSASLERTIGLIRDFPGLKVADVALMRSDGDDARHTLKIKVAPDRVRALAYMDNRGTDSIGRSRFYSSVSVSSLAMQGDDLRLDLFAMPGRRFSYLYGQLTGSMPIGRNGLRLMLAASKGDQHLVSAERFDGDSTNLLAQLSYPMLRSRHLTMIAKASLNDWRSYGEANDTRQLRDRLRVARLGVELSNEAKNRVQGDFTLSHGLGFDGMTRVGDPRASRADASGRFLKASFSIQATRPLSDKARVQAVLAGQLSNRPLLSAEEFSLGGNRIGRAFAFNALTADRGAGGGVEVSYRIAEPKGAFGGAELFGFFDGGAVHEAKSAIALDRKRTLASVGVGTRFNLARTAFSVEAGVPVAARGLDKSVRLYFSTYRSF